MVINISKQALQRMPYYLQHLKEMRDNGKLEVSAPYLAQQSVLFKGNPKSASRFLPSLLILKTFWDTSTQTKQSS